MAGISDSGNPDDIRVHLEEIVGADNAHREPEPDEDPQSAEIRQSVQLTPAMRRRLDDVLVQVRDAVPGLSAAEANKLLVTRSARDALKQGKETLARVDSHLQAVTGERNPQLGRTYGVYGKNPESFGGVYRALEQSLRENQRIESLPTDAADRARLFSPLISRAVLESRDALKHLLGERFSTRSELSQQVLLKGEVFTEANAVIAAVRNHLYANLPRRKKDPALRDYGFRPLRTGTRRSSKNEED